MTAETSAELRLVEDTAARLLADHFPPPRLRAMIASDAEFDDGVSELQHQAGDLGWYAPFVPGDFGGGSLGEHGIIDATIIARQRGHTGRGRAIADPLQHRGVRDIAAAQATSSDGPVDAAGRVDRFSS